MKQREIEAGGLQWSCVQALSGVPGAAAEAAERRMDQAERVLVVCTPRGAAQSVRLQLAPDWLERLSDEQLARAIEAAAVG